MPSVRRLLLLLLAPALGALALVAPAAHADPSPFPVTESFENSTLTDSAEWTLGDHAFLTASNGTDTAGNGWLRLTDATNNQEGYIYNTQAFPSSSGLDVTFDYASYGGTGADGLAFFLFNGAVNSFAEGPLGGSLGYASCPTSNQNGMTGGYVGIGFDEFGNFDNSGFCGAGGTSSVENPNAITVRGAAFPGQAASTSASDASGSYPVITSVPAQEHLDDATPTAPLKVNVAVSSSDLLTVYVTYPDGTVQTVESGFQLPSADLPSTLKFGWIASTGGSNDIHEVRNTTVAEPDDLHVAVSGPAHAARGTSVTYTATITNESGGNEADDTPVIASSPDGALQDVTWTCTGTGCVTASGTGLPDTLVSLPVGDSTTYTVTGTTTSTDTDGSLRVEADPTGVVTQSLPGDNVATATTDITPVQTTAPTIALTNNGGYLGTATLTQGSYSGGGVTVSDQWELCDLTGANCTNISGATGLTEAIDSTDRGHTLRVVETATNDADTITETTDATPLPASTTIGTHPTSVTASTAATFGISTTTAGAAFECLIDSGAWSNCSSTPTFTGLANGSHTLQTRAVYAGLSDASPTSFTWTVDSSTPTDTSSCPAPTGTGDNYVVDPTCSVSGADTISGIDHVAYRLDDGTIVTTPSGTVTASVPITGDGTHTLQTEVFNLAGTGSGWTTTTIFIDTVAPATPAITGPGDGAFIATNEPTLSATAEPGATVTFSIDGIVVGSATADGSGHASLALINALTDAAHTVSATATDEAGNASPAASATFTVESSAPPAPTVVTPVAGLVSSNSSPTVTVHGKPHDSVLVEVDGVDYGPVTLDSSGAGSVAVSGPLGDGQHAVRARETDQAGNVSVWSADSVWTVKMSTGISVNGPTGGPTKAIHPTVDFSGEPGDAYTVTVDGTVVATGVIPASGSGSLTLPDTLSDGDHTITITATDAAGNQAAQSLVVDVDTRSPVAPVKVGSAPAAVTSSTSATFHFAEPASTGTVTYRCSLDGGSWTTCPDPVSFSQLASGPHTLLVKAVDAAGNASASTQYAWTVQTTPPSAPALQGGPSTATIVHGARFHVSASPGTTLECSVDGGRYRACPDNLRLRSLGLGSHVLKVRQVDEAGNLSKPAEYHWTVLRRTTPAGLPRHAGLLVDGQSTATGSRRLDVGCNLDAGSIRRCTIVAYTHGRRIGSGTTREARRGSGRTIVSVRLNRVGQRLLARGTGGLRLGLRARVTPYGFDHLPASTTTVLYRPLRYVVRDVLFAFNSSRLTHRAHAILAGVARSLGSASYVQCVGNTDSVGPRAYNYTLGLRRAHTVCDALHALGVHARFGIASMGSSRPAASNATPAGRHANRRVVLRVNYRRPS
jgi:hypothetical protein